MNKIQFSIGPSDKFTHDLVIEWLKLNLNEFVIKDISFNGDHYSEIMVFGDYNAAYPELIEFKNISLEHWED